MPELHLGSRDLRIGYVDSGDGPTVLLLHSLGFDHSIYSDQIDFLTTNGFRVIAPDARSHGTSQDHAGACTMDDLAADVLALLDQIGISELALVGGLSMGGMVAQRLLLARPGLAERLLLIGTTADIEHHRDNYSDYLNSLQQLPAMADDMKQAIVQQLSGFLIQHCFAGSYLDPATTDKWLPVTTRFFSGIPGPTTAAVLDRQSIVDKLPSIPVQAMVLVGSEDQPLPEPNARQLAEHLPRATLKIIQGAGHILTAEQPDLVNSILEEFLND